MNNLITKAVVIFIFVILRQPVLSPDYVVVFSVCLREGVWGRGHEGVWRPRGQLTLAWAVINSGGIIMIRNLRRGEAWFVSTPESLLKMAYPRQWQPEFFFHINGEHLLNGLYLNKQKSQCQQQTTFYCNHGACFIALTRLEPLIWTEPWPRPEPDPRFWSGAGCRPADAGYWLMDPTQMETIDNRNGRSLVDWDSWDTTRQLNQFVYLKIEECFICLFL